jgi:hypothetical protein
MDPRQKKTTCHEGPVVSIRKRVSPTDNAIEKGGDVHRRGRGPRHKGSPGGVGVGVGGVWRGGAGGGGSTKEGIESTSSATHAHVLAREFLRSRPRGYPPSRPRQPKPRRLKSVASVESPEGRRLV